MLIKKYRILKGGANLSRLQEYVNHVVDILEKYGFKYETKTSIGCGTKDFNIIFKMFDINNKEIAYVNLDHNRNNIYAEINDYDVKTISFKDISDELKLSADYIINLLIISGLTKNFKDLKYIYYETINKDFNNLEKNGYKILVSKDARLHHINNLKKSNYNLMEPIQFKKIEEIYNKLYLDGNNKLDKNKLIKVDENYNYFNNKEVMYNFIKNNKLIKISIIINIEKFIDNLRDNIKLI